MPPQSLTSAPLDQIDLKIIWELDKNSRRPLTELAKLSGISKQSANYHLQKLTREGVIKGFISAVDIHQLGYLTYRVYLRFKNVGKEKEKEIIKTLVQNDYTLWVVSTVGSWDLEVVFTARNFIHFNNIFKVVRLELSACIAKYNISLSPVSYHFTRDYLINSPRKNFTPTYYGFEPKPGKWDLLDLRILGELSRDCRQSHEEISEKLEVTAHTVKQHISKLEKSKIIQSHRILLDLEKIGRQYLKVLLSMKPLTKEEEKKFFNFCAERNHVIYLTEVIGDWHMEIETEVQARDELTELMRDIRVKFPDFILDYELLEVSYEHKMNYFPVGEKLLQKNPELVLPPKAE